MSIVVQCPHCETKFNLQPDMVGKSMRCPNLECRQVFTVKQQAREIEPPRPEPLPLPPEPTRTRKPEKSRPKPAAQPAVVDAEIIDAAVVAPPKVKEVVWSEGTEAPPRGKQPVKPELLDDTGDQPILRRKKKKSRGAWILVGMSVVIVALIGFGVLYVLRFQDITEKNLAKQADEEYAGGDFAAAAKSFEKLATDYSTSDEAPRYQFFADLAGMKVVVFAVTNRENPEPAADRLKQFIEARKDSPFAKHTSGFGRDIHEVGRKLGEDIAGHGNDKLKSFRADRSGKPDDLARAEQAVAIGRELLPRLEPFRAPDDVPLDSIRRDLDHIEVEVKREGERTIAIARAQSLLEKQTDAAIQQAENELTAAGFDRDPDAMAMIASAKGRLRELVRYETDPAAPRDPPISATSSLLFVAPIGATGRAPPDVGVEGAPSIFLAVARGILYALDEESGSLLWAVRVGADIADPPTVARVELDDGPTDLAIVASNVAGQAALAGYVVKTGAPRWYQPLPAPAAGPAIVVGTRAYVAIRDGEGTIYEFDLTSGTRRGRIRLGQPVGHNGLSLRPGTGLLYVAADARRVYVIDAGAKDDDGLFLPPRCVQVIATGHLPGTLRTPPLLLGPDGDAPAERWLILSQANGRSMLLRAFALLPIQPPPPDGKAPPETLAVPRVELPLNGWTWYPAVSDGEWLAAVTDFGQFRVFGVNQPGSLDPPLFSLPDVRTPLPVPPEGRAVRGLVFAAEEASYWVVANGNLQKFRRELVPSRTLELIPVGASIPLGEPTQPPQLNGRKDAACLVVRPPNSGSSKAVLINLRDGSIRWQRQLGLVPAATPVAHGEHVLVVGEDGGVIAIPRADVAAAGRSGVAPPDWIVAPPADNPAGPTSIAQSIDRKVVYTVTPVVVVENQKTIPKFVIRRISGGRVVHEGAVNATSAIAGSPVVLGDSLLLPLADGFVHRLIPGTRPNPDTLSAGPLWVGERRHDELICHITPLTDSAFLTSDGGKKLVRWDWPADGRWSPGGATWELRDRPVGPGVLVPPIKDGGPARFAIADATGSVWLFTADRGGQPLRRWRPGGGLPGGEPSSRLGIQAETGGRHLIAYTVANKVVVCLDPERDLPLWVQRNGDEAESILIGTPQPFGVASWTTTDLTGSVAVVASDTGLPAARLKIGLPGAVPAVEGTAIDERTILVFLSDGSAVVLPLPALPASAPDPKTGR